MSTFANESEFEAAVIHELRQCGWGEAEVIKNPTEADLLANWAQILFENNRGVDRLNEEPLTEGEIPIELKKSGVPVSVAYNQIQKYSREGIFTGFDSKWVNTLYLDKLLEYENVIQAFSRTNRLFHPLEKPFGTIRYYRKPHTMTRNIEAAVKLYSGDKPLGLFAERLPMNLARMNATFAEINAIFNAAGIADFMNLPDDPSERAAFAKQFNQFNAVLEAAKIQGFVWEKTVYEFGEDPTTQVELAITLHQYSTLLQRYKELGSGAGGGGGAIPFDIDSHITEMAIGIDLMNFALRVYGQLKLSASDSLKGLLEALGSFFPGGRRAVTPPTP